MELAQKHEIMLVNVQGNYKISILKVAESPVVTVLKGGYKEIALIGSIQIYFNLSFYFK